MMPTMNLRLSLALLCASVLLVYAASASAVDPGWVTPSPPYPAKARITHEQGKIIIRVTTDATGRVIKATASVPTGQKDDLPNVTQTCVKWVLAYWHGPPNTARKVTLEYMLR